MAARYEPRTVLSVREPQRGPVAAPTTGAVTLLGLLTVVSFAVGAALIVPAARAMFDASPPGFGPVP